MASLVIIAFLSILARVLVLGKPIVTPTLEIYPKARCAMKAVFLSAFSSPHLTHYFMGKTSSATCNINYHIVWCSKYRKTILTGKVKSFVEDQLETIAQTKGYKILESRVMPDHIHLFIEANPFDSPTNIIKIFKGVTSLRMFKKFPQLRQGLCAGYYSLHHIMYVQLGMPLLK